MQCLCNLFGKYYRHDQIPENVVPKKVEIVKIKSTNSVSISSVLAGMSYRVKFTEQRHAHTYYIGKEFINKQQLQNLKEMIIVKEFYLRIYIVLIGDFK